MEKIICIILLVLYGVVMLMMCCITLFKKNEKPKNKVHFYIARDKNGRLYLHIGKPERRIASFLSRYGSYINSIANESSFKYFGLNPDDFKDLKWEDEPVEVFLNMED